MNILVQLCKQVMNYCIILIPDPGMESDKEGIDLVSFLLSKMYYPMAYCLQLYNNTTHFNVASLSDNPRIISTLIVGGVTLTEK